MAAWPLLWQTRRATWSPREGTTRDASVRFDPQIVGALPVLVPDFEQLDLAATIDRNVPGEGDIPRGTLVEVLIANQLLQPQARFRVGQWAPKAARTDDSSRTVGQLNDARLGRARERLAEHALTLPTALVLKAIEHFQRDVHQIHSAIATVALVGAFASVPVEGLWPPSPWPTAGRSQSGRQLS